MELRIQINNKIQLFENTKKLLYYCIDNDVIQTPSSYYVCQYIAKLVNEGFYQEGGRIRGVPVKIGGSSYIPPLPIERFLYPKIFAMRNTFGNPMIRLCGIILKFINARKT